MLSGQVGKTIYQIKNNGDGTYTQVAYNKGERTETSFSPKLQAQRMCMGMVESLMKQLKPLIGISFQAGTNKTKSCNAFSAANLRLVQRDCMEHWYADNKFVFPYQYKGYPDFSELGGLYMISSGSLKQNLYDELIFDSYAPAQWRDLPYSDSALWGLKFNVRVGVDTLEQFRQAHKMTILDKICFAGFKTWISFDPDPEDPQTLSKHDYFIASFNRSFPSNVVLTPDVLVDLFQFKTNAAPAVYISRDNDAICVGCCLDYQHADESYFYWAGFSESHLTGKRLISTSFYGNDYPDGDPYLLERQPSMVFGSWMGEPTVKPYPSPFAPSPIPPTPSRLPAEYQEVQYVTAVDDIAIVAPINYSASTMILEFSVIYNEYRSAYLFSQGTADGMLRYNTQTYAGGNIMRLRSRLSGQTILTDLNERFSLNTLYRFKVWVENNQIAVDLNDVISRYDNDGVAVACLSNIFYIFGFSTYFTRCSLYEIIIRSTANGSVIHDLVPCYRKSDGAIGFYDIIDNAFYTALDSQTKMTYGPIVNPY